HGSKHISHKKTHKNTVKQAKNAVFAKLEDTFCHFARMVTPIPPRLSCTKSWVIKRFTEKN
ncbi:MAG: hypothetical protein LBD48_01680, partial [Treponema sp.]|nr:hypothetical protein [Treponema sp.]